MYLAHSCAQFDLNSPTGGAASTTPLGPGLANMCSFYRQIMSGAYGNGETFQVGALSHNPGYGRFARSLGAEGAKPSGVVQSSGPSTNPSLGVALCLPGSAERVARDVPPGRAGPGPLGKALPYFGIPKRANQDGPRHSFQLKRAWTYQITARPVDLIGD